MTELKYLTFKRNDKSLELRLCESDRGFSLSEKRGSGRWEVVGLPKTHDEALKSWASQIGVLSLRGWVIG